MPRKYTKKVKKKQNIGAGVLLGFFLALVSFAGYQAIAERRDGLADSFFNNKSEVAQSETIVDKESIDEKKIKEEELDEQAQEKSNSNSESSNKEETKIKENNESETVEKSAIGGPGFESEEYVNSKYSFSIKVPKEWHVDESVEGRVAFGKEKPDSNYQYIGNFVINHRENPENLEIEDYYNIEGEPDFFADALEGYKPYKVNDTSGYKFFAVQGYIPSNVVVLKDSKSKSIFEITDIGMTLEESGQFEEIMQSIKIK